MGFAVETGSVSIIIPTFNGSTRIGNCLKALLDQTTGRSVEILVVDDGSTDNTAEVVNRYPGVRLIKQKITPARQQRVIAAPWRPRRDHLIYGR